MSTTRNPSADIRRRYPTFLQIGLLLALGLTIAAFTVDTPDRKKPAAQAREDLPLALVQVDVTRQFDTPRPPAAQPPPIEVDDAVDVDELIADIAIDFGDSTIPVGPPAGPTAPPPPPPVVESPELPTPIEEDFDDTDEPRDFVEVEPVLIGGLEGLQSRVSYPPFARQIGAEGIVYVQFVVERNGDVSNVVVARSPNALLSEAAAKAIRESRFEPGSQQGRPVRVRYTLPVRFVLR